MSTPSFEEFYFEVHGYAPFPWQSRLAARVVSEGWPGLLDLPTGSGKTSAIDIALYALAVAPEKAHRRIFLVVDRRIIVHQAAEHARKILAALQSTEAADVVKDIAQRLRALFLDDSEDSRREAPFAVAELRGGMPRETEWARRPDQPVVGISTVDQVGSRLLFRGYGISPRMAPVHAGLLGNDVLFLLDEVHLSQPFAETLDAIANRWRRKGGARFSVVPMSATPGGEQTQEGDAAVPVDSFSLDVDSDYQNEVLSQRLNASKPASYQEVKVAGGERKRRERLAKECAEKVNDMLKAGARVIGIVVNRVDTARATQQYLKKDRKLSKLLGSLGGRAVLLTGRMRPLDRDALMKERHGELTLEQCFMTRKERGDHPPLVIVSTQCIEAGADYDFDGLVTQCASLDALRQRFGRLDRKGVMKEKDSEAQAVILMRSDQVAPKQADPVYGDALPNTWAWLLDVAKRPSAPQLDEEPLDGQQPDSQLLASHPSDSQPPVSQASNGEQPDVVQPNTVDFGITALEGMLPVGTKLTQCIAPKKNAPPLLPTHLDAWAHTSPKPLHDHDVAFWLHGEDNSSPEVSIVWRADITAEQLAAAQERGDNPGYAVTRQNIADTLAACPPAAIEALSVPLYAAKAWLRGDAEQPEVSDTLNVPGEEAPRVTKPQVERLAYRSRYKDGGVVGHRQLAAGDTLVVPVDYGGLTERNWDPGAEQATSDLGDLAQLRARGKLTLRTYAHALIQWGFPADPMVPLRSPVVAAEKGEGEGEVDEGEVIQAWLEKLPEKTPMPHLSDDWGKLRAALVQGRGLRWSTLPNDHYALRGPNITKANAAKTNHYGVATTEDDDGSFIAQPVSLKAHSQDVENWARRFVANLTLEPALANDIVLAAWLHDIGKADPRFQRWLNGGAEVSQARMETPLAKSAEGQSDRRKRDMARVNANYPRGYRHELLSLNMLEQHASLLEQAHDRELVLHLVASHHGYCRPLAPAYDQPEDLAIEYQHVGEGHDAVHFVSSTRHELARLNSGVSSRFNHLLRKYGWWQLAWYETILRLADHRASQFPTIETEAPR